MSYCSASDVQSMFQGITFGTTATKILSTEVAQWITEADAEIDGYLGGVYVTPITGTAALNIIKQIATKLVAHRAERRIYVNSGSNEIDRGRKTDLRTEALKSLEAIQKKNLLLSDATLKTTHDGSSGYMAVNTDLEHTFKKGEDQW
jgi:phage gp36-like protein